MLPFCLGRRGRRGRIPDPGHYLDQSHAPGGTLDLQGRAFATIAEKIIGQPMVVVNKPGATGMVGGLAGAQAAPDGYTLTVGSVNLTNAIEWESANGRKPPFTRHDFIPICSFTLSPTLLIVHPDSPWKTLDAFMKRCQSQAGSGCLLFRGSVRDEPPAY